MTINGKNTIPEYGVQQWKVEPGFSEVKNQSEWIEGAVSPILLKGVTGFKKMKVTVMIRGSTRQEIWKKSGDFIATLLEPCDIQLDGFDHHFMVYLSNPSQAETSLNRWHTATLELIGYEQGSEVAVSTSAKDFIITNEGNRETPAVVELTPAIGLVSVKINGLVRDGVGEKKPIVIKNLTKGRTICIDGEKGLITESGANKFKDAELWDFPLLMPGKNHISLECLESQQELANVTIKYKPRYI